MNDTAPRLVFVLVGFVLLGAVLSLTNNDEQRALDNTATDHADVVGQGDDDGTASQPNGQANGQPNGDDVSPPKVAQRSPWTTSHVSGSPEPPPPLKTVRAFPKLQFEKPLLMTMAPGLDRFFVVEQSGRIYSFPNDRACETPELFLNLKASYDKLTANSDAKGMGACYGLTFHPNFAENRYCYVCYTLTGTTKSGKQMPNGTRVVRFTVTDTDPPTCDVESEQVVIDWLGGGHNGGCLKFGPDGYLYISSGDGSFPNPPDALFAGQDVSNLLSSVMRIDVNNTDEDLAYAIPEDNPFVDLEGARPEIWAYGFRNPWKISFDRATGELWLGDVGWELYEMVHRIESGGNYGWSIMEGRQSVHPEAKRGPTPIRPAMISLPHSEAASVTGGFVYRGKNFPELVGAYVFGDWETRRMWAARFEGDKLTSRVEVVDPTVRLVAFAEDRDGELLMLDYDAGTIHEFAVNEDRNKPSEFPRKLSETGLFASVTDHAPAPGVTPFTINAEMWADNALAERWIALPSDTSVIWHPERVKIPGTIMLRTFEFPVDGVLTKTLSLEMEQGNPASRRHVETQIMHFNGKRWNGYSYRWNDEQTDAELVPSAGAEQTFQIADATAPAGKRRQTWVFPSRAACVRCHNSWSTHTLAFNVRQLDRDHPFPSGRVFSQLELLKMAGILKHPVDEEGKPLLPPTSDPSLQITNPHDVTADINSRARSYLQVNCSHCHQKGAGGTADIELRAEFALHETKTLGVRPMQGTFGIHDAHILSIGDPYRSVLYYRMSKIGRGRMPHIGSTQIDERGVRLIHDWIRQLPSRPEEAARIANLKELDEPSALAHDDRNALREAAEIARNIAKSEERDVPNEADRDKARQQQQQQAASRVAKRAKERANVIAELLGRTTSSLLLSRAFGENELPTGVRNEVLAASLAHDDPAVRDLFEKFLPEELRAKKLGSVVDVAALLAIEGDAERGRTLFFEVKGVQCKNCHRIGDVGSKLGPELSAVGKKNDRAKLLESMLEPSKFIEPKYVVHLVETTAGKVHTGLLVKRTATEIVLRDAKDKPIRIPTGDVEQIVPQRQSLMPELLLRDMTAEQVADLLAFLSGLK
jgi:uncharacterized repeat protein (TIGR03806 family)